MNKQGIKDAETWYDQNKDVCSAYCKHMIELLEKLISNEGIIYSSVSGRVKEKKSYLEKCKKDKYTDRNQIMDIVGIRVVTYVQKDVEKICNLLENEFKVDQENSINKRTELKENEFGYLSFHYILTHNQTRKELPEYNIYKGMSCEIQIRTLLQHSWAEISHDNNYKFSGVLPPEINRKFYMIAGALELIDTQFQSIADELETYTKTIEEQIKSSKGQIDLPIDSSSLYEYLISKLGVTAVNATFSGADKLIIEELKLFGINTIKELDNIFPPNYKENLKKINLYQNFLSVLRDCMIIENHTKYFEESWRNSWQATTKKNIDFLAAYGVNTAYILDILNQHNLA